MPAIAVIFGQAAVILALIRPQLSMSNQVSRLCTCRRFDSAAVMIITSSSNDFTCFDGYYQYEQGTVQMIRKLCEAYIDTRVLIRLSHPKGCGICILPSFLLFISRLLPMPLVPAFMSERLRCSEMMLRFLCCVLIPKSCVCAQG